MKKELIVGGTIFLGGIYVGYLAGCQHANKDETKNDTVFECWTYHGNRVGDFPKIFVIDKRPEVNVDYRVV